MKQGQSASDVTAVESVTDGQSDSLVNMTKNYPGGKDKLQLALSNPDCRKVIWNNLDKLADKQALRLLMQRPIWQVLTRTCADAKDYIADLKASCYRIGDWAAGDRATDIMEKPDFKKGFDITSVELVTATGKELTGSDAPTTAKIYDAIRKAGGEPCPAWVGPELRKQYPDQPNGEVLVIAMETITDSDGDPRLFRVGRGFTDRWLDAGWGAPGCCWSGSDRWVFLRRK